MPVARSALHGWWIGERPGAFDSRRVTKRTRGEPDPAEAAVQLVASRLAALRRAAGMTQEQLAVAARVSVKYLSEIENARTNVSVGALARIAQGLGVSLSGFFGDGDDQIIGDLAAVAAVVGAQGPEARQQALRVLRALYPTPTR
jgi:transcriptional regulator with XRE-family HTH domain